MTTNPLKALAALRNGNWFITAIESVQGGKKDSRHDPGWFHPSSLAHICDAFLAFQFLGAPTREEITPRLQRIFDNGSGRDVWLKKDTSRAGISLIKEEADRKIEIPELRIRGELDEFVKNPMTGETMVVDFKTMNESQWKELKEQVPSHTIQLHPYVFAKQADAGGVLYENKNTQELKFFSSKFNYQLWNIEIVGRIRRILTELKAGRSPQRTPIQNDSKCPFYHICSTANMAQMAKESGLTLDV